MWDFVNVVLADAGPLVFVALGGLVAFRAGIFHIGLEGLMILGAFGSVAFTSATGSVTLGVLGAVAVCSFVQVVFWFLVAVLRANAIIVGIGLNTAAVGLTTFLLQAVYAKPGGIAAGHELARPVHSQSHGPLAMVSDLSIFVWCAPVICFAMWLLLRRTRFGLRIAAVGEHPFAARSAGVNVRGTQLQAMLLTGVLASLGGTDLALGGLGTFTSNMTNGRGYLAIAAVLLGGISAVGTPLAALFFGLADGVAIRAQLSGFHAIPLSFVLMLPYVVTLVVVFVIGVLRRQTLESISNSNELRL